MSQADSNYCQFCPHIFSPTRPAEKIKTVIIHKLSGKVFVGSSCSASGPCPGLEFYQLGVDEFNVFDNR